MGADREGRISKSVAFAVTDEYEEEQLYNRAMSYEQNAGKSAIIDSSGCTQCVSNDPALFIHLDTTRRVGLRTIDSKQKMTDGGGPGKICVQAPDGKFYILHLKFVHKRQVPIEAVGKCNEVPGY